MRERVCTVKAMLTPIRASYGRDADASARQRFAALVPRAAGNSPLAAGNSWDRNTFLRKSPWTVSAVTDQRRGKEDFIVFFLYT